MRNKIMKILMPTYRGKLHRPHVSCSDTVIEQLRDVSNVRPPYQGKRMYQRARACRGCCDACARPGRDGDGAAKNKQTFAPEEH